MSGIAEAFRLGGIWMYLVLLVGLGTGGWLVVQSLLTATGNRIPAPIWWIGPSLILVCGALGIYFGLGDALAALEHVSPEKKQQAVARGASLAMNVGVFATMATAALALLGTLGIGLSRLVGSSDDSRWSWGRPLAAVGIAAVGALGLSVWTLAATLGIGTLAVPAVLFLGTLGAAAASAPTGDTAVPRGAASADRVAASLGVFVSAVSACAASCLLGLIDAFQALENVAAENRSEMWSHASGIVVEVGFVGLAAAGLAAVIGAVLLTTELDGLSTRRFMIESILSAVVFLPAIGAIGLAGVKSNDFSDVFQNTITSPETESSAAARPGDATSRPTARATTVFKRESVEIRTRGRRGAIEKPVIRPGAEIRRALPPDSRRR